MTEMIAKIERSILRGPSDSDEERALRAMD
jgi:hypothetical protein